MSSRVAEVRTRFEALPRKRFAHLPAPLEHCPWLSADLGGTQIWIKRDDSTGLAFGGNKARQLDYVLGDAIAQGSDVVVQGAASQSNHSRQLAAAAARVGLDSVIVPRWDAMFEVGGGNHLVTRLLAGRLEPVRVEESVAEAKAAVADRLRRSGRHPYVVGMGAERALTLAAVAYVEALCEIVGASGERGEPLPCDVYTTSQGSTQAGLQLGVLLLGLGISVVGINPMDEANEAYIPEQGIVDLISTAAGVIGYPKMTPGEVVNDTSYVGPAYGIPSGRSRKQSNSLPRRKGFSWIRSNPAKGSPAC